MQHIIFYFLNIFFFSLQDSAFKVHETKVEFVLCKQKHEWWPRLTAQPQKPHWLKIDFDRWRPEDEDLELLTETRDIIVDYPGVHDELQKEEYGYRKEQGKTVYLVLYNLFQFVGFLYILTVIGIRYYRDGTDSIPGTYESVGNAVKFCQLLMYLESMHPLFGYTKGSAIVPFLQVTFRCFVLILMIDMEERMQTKPVVFYLIVVWSLIEVVRYPYYISILLKCPVHILTWMRYTLWIPLIPMGIFCEAVVVLRNIPYFEQSKRFTVTMPNAWNATFDMPFFMKAYLIVLILPVFYLVMNHMYTARVKHLSTNKNKIKAF